jgi:hypothetical protein
MTDDLPAVRKVGRPKIVSQKVRTAIEALATGEVKTISAAARTAGMSREALSKSLQKTHVDEYRVRRIHAARKVGALRASAKMSKLIDSPNGIVSLRACEFELGVGAGLVKPSDHRNSVSVNVGVNVMAGYVLDLREPNEAPSSPPAPAGNTIDLEADELGRWPTVP